MCSDPSLSSPLSNSSSEWFETEIRVRYRDLDTFGHVNNAVFLSYFEQARADFFKELFEKYQFRFVLVHLCIDYHHPAYLLETLLVRLRVTRIGHTSFSFQYQILRKEDQHLIATGESVQVVVNTKDQKEPIPSYLRAYLEKYLS